MTLRYEIEDSKKTKVMQDPFIHKFETQNNKYIYDVNTNQIVRVDPIVYSIINDYKVLKNRATIEKFNNKFDKKEIKRSIDIITRYSREKGLFSDFRPTKISYSENKENLREQYKSNLRHLTLNVTEDCNLRCKYCTFSGTYPYERNHRKIYMNFNVARKAIDFFCNHSGETERIYLSFYGGEPLLNLKLIEQCVNYLNERNKKKDHSFGVTTNGTLMSKRIIRFLTKNNFSLLVSLNGPQDVHDKYRVFKNGNGSFRLIVNNLEKLKAYDDKYFRNKVSFSIIVTPPYDFDKIDNFFAQHFKDLVRENKISFVTPYDTTFFDNFSENELDTTSFFKTLYEKYISATIQGRFEGIKMAKAICDINLLPIHRREMNNLAETFGPNGTCLPGRRRLFVSPNGNFYMCEKVGYFFDIGNVNTGFDFGKIFALMDEYCAISTIDCCHCWAIRLCSACFLSAKKGSKLNINRKREYCKRKKASIDQYLKIYCSILEKNPTALDFLKEMIYV